MAALSKGSFYNQWIRDDYPFVRERRLQRAIGDAVDLDLGVDHQRRLHGRARRRHAREMAGIDLVEAPEVARVGEPHVALDHVVQRAAGLLEDAAQILDGLPRLLDDAAIHQLAVLVMRHLAGDVDEIPGADRRTERQRLAAGAAARRADLHLQRFFRDRDLGAAFRFGGHDSAPHGARAA